MKRFAWGAVATGAAMAAAGAAHAEVSANVAFTSDYVFRGVSLSDNGPAVQGGVDWTNDQFYAGAWGSSLAEGAELDLYAGVTPTTGPLTWDFGAMFYAYPGADDDGAEQDYIEFKASVAAPITDAFSIGAGLYWAPDNYGDTGEAIYYEVSAEWAMTDSASLSAAFGNQRIEDPDGPFGAAGSDDYNSWNIGASAGRGAFSLDIRYHDTDIDAGSDIEAYTYGPSSYDEAIVVTITRAANAD